MAEIDDILASAESIVAPQQPVADDVFREAESLIGAEPEPVGGIDDVFGEAESLLSTGAPPSPQAEALQQRMRAEGELPEPEPEQPDEAPERGVLGQVGRELADVGLAAARGVVGIPEASLGVAEILEPAVPFFLSTSPLSAAVPFGAKAIAEATGLSKRDASVISKTAKRVGIDFETTKNFIDSFLSPEVRKDQKEVAKAKGFFRKVVNAAKRPRVIAQAVAESVPGMLAGGAMGRALVSEFPKLTPLVAAAIGEGVLTSGQTAEAIRKADPDGVLTGKGRTAAVGAGVATSLLSVMGGRAASKLGIDDVDTLLTAGASKGSKLNVLKKAALGMITEGALEELPQSAQEQMATNIGQGRPVTEGVADAAAIGWLTGAAMGGGTQVATSIADARGDADQVAVPAEPGAEVAAEAAPAVAEQAPEAAEPDTAGEPVAVPEAPPPVPVQPGETAPITAERVAALEAERQAAAPLTAADVVTAEAAGVPAVAEPKPRLPDEPSTTTSRQTEQTVREADRKRNLSLMSTDQDTRNTLANLDADMAAANEVQRQTFSEWDRQADERLQSDPDGLYLALLSGELDLSDPVNQRMAMKLLDTHAAADVASGDLERHARAKLAMLNMRNQRTEIARAMAAGRDPMATPEQRAAEMITGFFLDPGQTMARKLQGKSEVQKLRALKRQARKMERVRKRLLDMGIDIGNLDLATLGDPIKLAEIMRELQTAKAGFNEMEFEYWRNAILSAPTTQAANIIGNSLNTVTEYALLRPLEATVNKLTGDKIKSGTTFGDLAAVYRGIMPGIIKGARNFVQAFVTEQPIADGTKLENTGLAIAGKKGRIVRLPQRLLLAADEFAKGMIMQMEVAAQASRMAREQGLQGDAMAAFVEDSVKNTNSEAWSAALDKARELTFQTKPGEFSKLVMRGREMPGIGGFIFRHVAPFVVTPINIAKMGVRRTPFGALGLAKSAIDAARGKDTGGNVARRAVEQMLAWSATMMLYGMVNPDEGEEPRITGSAAALNARGKRDLQYRTYPPQSIRIGNRWWSYSRIEPFATTLSTIADLLTNDGEKLDAKSWRILTGLMRDKTFLRGLNDIMAAIESDNPRKVSEWASNFAASYMPNLIRSGVRSWDPFLRNMHIDDPKDIWGNWMKRTGQRAFPAAPLMPPPKIDLWGNEIIPTSDAPVSDTLWRLMAPIRVQPAGQVVDADRLIINWNAQNPEKPFYPTLPRPTFKRNGKTMRMDKPTYTAFLKERGQFLRERLEAANLNIEQPTARDVKLMKTWIRRADARAKRMIRRQRPQGVTEQ